MFNSISSRRWAALALIVVAQFMVVLDVSIVNVALSSIKTDLGFSETGLQWVITAYAIVFGGFLLLGGRLGDLYGRRRMFVVGLLVFAAGSALCRARVVVGVADRLPCPAGCRRRAVRSGRALAADDDVRRGARPQSRDRRLGALPRAAAARSASCSAACSPPT